VKIKALIFVWAVAPFTFAAKPINKSVTPEQASEIFSGWNDQGFHKEHCRATEEFVKALEFMRKEKSIPEKEARRVSVYVAAGCDGAAERFSKAYLIMRKSGVALQKAIDVGLALVNEDSLTINNFYEIFEKMYLGEYFDVNLQTAFEIAYELSKEFRGNLDVARMDFNKFTKFCMDDKQMGLSVPQCAKLSVKFTRLSQFFPRGIFEPFKEVYMMLREDKRFGVSMKEALEFSEKIIRNGPMARVNFLQAYNYASMKDGLNLPGREALGFAVKMAGLSSIGEEPPIFPGSQLFRKRGDMKSGDTASGSETSGELAEKNSPADKSTIDGDYYSGKK
jgi:hypothetical protein